MTPLPSNRKPRFSVKLAIPDFIKQNSQWIAFWIVIAVVLGAIAWGILLALLDNYRREVDNAALREAGALSQNYARNLDRAIDGIDQLLLHVKYEWELSRGGLRLESMVGKDLFPPASEVNIGIIDRDGKAITESGRSMHKLALVNQLFFQVHKNLEPDALYIGKLYRLSPLGSFIPFSRRLTKANGQFNGILVAFVSQSYFMQHDDVTTPGKNRFWGMVGADRDIRAAQIGPRALGAQSSILTSIPHFTTKSGKQLMNGGQWFDDHRNRYVGWQTLQAYPVIAMVGVDQTDALAQFRTYREIALNYAEWATAALVVGALLAMMFSIRLATKRRQLELSQAGYRLASDDSIEGFYIVQPVFDRQNYPLDFMVIDCNSRGAELVNLRHEQLLGKRLSRLPRGAFNLLLKESLFSAMETGYFENEIEVDLAGHTRWLYLKVIRSDSNLAVRLRDISDTKAHVAELERRGHEDALTALPNRHWANVYLPQAIDRAAATDAMLAILFIDLDGFKAVNDSLGHEAGDELLRKAGQRLKVAVRPSDHVVRIGGDEFVVILEPIESREDAAHVAERILHAFQNAFRLTQGVQSVGASIGISVYPHDGSDASTMLRNADIAMYSVKTSGKRHYRFFDPNFYDALRARMEKETELQRAIELDQFIMHYQPRVDMKTGAVCSMEALVRWAHPTKGLINPLEFIPMAEETGLILGLGDLVINKVCAQVAKWMKTGQQLVPVSINVSPRQFNEADVAKALSDAIARHHIDPRLVEIELTESTMMADGVAFAADLAVIQKLGVKIVVDDFGTGYSSLSQLQRLDFDVLKVDQAFTARLEGAEEGKVFFKAIITMAHALGMRVVAEGVENQEQVNALRSLQCDEIQGFFVSMPLPASDQQPLSVKNHLSSTV
jgi:diguanylate cyclase (GGDEF)-like protein